MVRAFAFAAASIAALSASSVSATTVINLASVDTATGGAPMAQTLLLGAGTYVATVINTATNGAIYGGWDKATDNGQLYPSGIPHPAPGFFTEAYDITVGSAKKININTAIYNSYGQAFSAAKSFSFNTTSASTPVTFEISDTFYNDNSGGVSLSISAVPETATWAMMIMGVGAIGVMMRRVHRRSEQRLTTKIRGIANV